MGGIGHKLLLPPHGFLHGLCGHLGELDADQEKAAHGPHPDGQQHQSQVQHGVGNVVCRGQSHPVEAAVSCVVVYDVAGIQGAELGALGGNGFQQLRQCALVKIVIGRKKVDVLGVRRVEDGENVLALVVLPGLPGTALAAWLFKRLFGFRSVRKSFQGSHHLLHGGFQPGIIVPVHIYCYQAYHHGQNKADEQHIELDKTLAILRHFSASSR